MDSRLTSLVFVTLESGLSGVGAAYSHPGIVRTIVEEHLAPFLIGEDPTHTEELWHEMYLLTQWYGRKGVAISAIGAVDTALWDLRGKLEGAPVYQLLGANTAEVEAYASGLLWQDDLASLAEEARRHVGNGFKLMKMRLGRSLAYDRDAVMTVSEAIDGKARLAVDGTHQYSLADAAALGQLLAERDVAWFEEPFRPSEIDLYTQLRPLVSVPISAGENEFGVEGFRELLRAGAVDIAQPDVSRSGGITECMRIGRLAQEYQVRVVTHTWSDAVAVTANAHLVAALDNGDAVEVDQTGCPFIEQLLVEPLALRSGRLHLTDRPGLGIEVDPAALERWTLARGKSIPSGNYADLVFGGRSIAPATTSHGSGSSQADTTFE